MKGGGLRSLWSLAAGARGAQPGGSRSQRGGGPCHIPPPPSQRNPFRCHRSQPHVLVPQGTGEGTTASPTFEGSQEQQGGPAHSLTHSRVGTSGTSPLGTSPGLSSPPPTSPRVYPSLPSPSSAHSCSSLGGRLGGPGDTDPSLGSSPAICQPPAPGSSVPMASG